MTVQVIQMFAPTVMVTTATTLFTVPTTPSNIVLNRGMVRFVNTGSNAATVTAYDITSGSSATVTTTFCPGLSITGNSTLDVAVPAMAAGATLQALASVGTVISVHAMDGVLFS